MVKLQENTNARTRLLSLVEIMTMYSDEQNILSIEEICNFLNDYGYNVSKRTVLSDIRAINTTPIKIIAVSQPKKGYYIAKAFSQEAISLILESVFSSELLTDNDVEYIKKYLRRCTCIPTLNLVLDTMVNLNKLSPERKELGDSIKNIRVAIKEKKQLELKVSYPIPGDSFSTSRDYIYITVNPVVLAVTNGTVVLVFTQANSPQKAEYIHISRIESAVIGNDAVEFTGSPDSAENYFGHSPVGLNLAKKNWLLLRFRTEDIDIIENHFNYPVEFRKDDEDGYCIAKVCTTIDYSLIGWLFTLSNKIQILSPLGLTELFGDKTQFSSKTEEVVL